MDESVTEVRRVRERSGIVPGRLLVLRLETLDANQRAALERFNVNVVEELQENRDGRATYRLLVQFSDDMTLGTFLDECDRYAFGSQQQTMLPRGTQSENINQQILDPRQVALPQGIRRDLFDSLESVSRVSAEERTGRRLQRESSDLQESFHLDVDLWDPGSDENYAELMASFRGFIESEGRAANQRSLTTS